MSDIAIRVDNLSKLYRIGAELRIESELRDAISDCGLAELRIADCGWRTIYRRGERPAATTLLVNGEDL